MNDHDNDLESISLKYLDDRIIFFGDVIYKESVEEFKSKFNYLTKKSNAPLTIYFNSPGGTVNDGFSMARMIADSNAPVTTVNVGIVCGMAVFPFVAGVKGGRRCLAHTTATLNPIQRLINGIPTSINYEGEPYLIAFLKSHTRLSDDLYNKLSEYELRLDALSQVRFGLSDGIAAKSAKTGKVVEGFQLIENAKNAENVRVRRPRKSVEQVRKTVEDRSLMYRLKKFIGFIDLP